MDMGSTDERHCHKHELVSLGSIVSRELKNEKMEKPTVTVGSAAYSRKGEDYFLINTDCQRISGNPSTSFSVFGIFDGHNGTEAAIFSRDNLLDCVLGAIPRGLGRDEWIQALPRALVAGFVKADKDFQHKKNYSGTTATLVIVDGWTVTVACAGDSRCILDAQGNPVSDLTVDHRLQESAEEQKRIAACGGAVVRDMGGHLRCGGLCLSRAIGDMDVGEFIVPVPHVKQVKLSNVGGRLIIASDGVWDTLSSETAAKCCRGVSAELAAKEVVKEALRTRGLKDDTTCVVVDIIPPYDVLPPPKKINKFLALLSSIKFLKLGSKKSKKLSAVGSVEELFEQGSAMLAERLCSGDSSSPTDGIFICAVCQADLAPNDGLSVHAGSVFSLSSNPCEGPFLCSECLDKKDAMEGKPPRESK